MKRQYENGRIHRTFRDGCLRHKDQNRTPRYARHCSRSRSVAVGWAAIAAWLAVATRNVSVQSFVFNLPSKEMPHLNQHPMRRSKRSVLRASGRKLSRGVCAEVAGSTAHGHPSVGLDDTQSFPEQLDLNIVLIDNYDSYTYNLYQYLASICIVPPIVVFNDAYGSWDELSQSIKGDCGGRDIDCVVISPGPGTPTNPSDIGICEDLIESNPDLPILGVCLGHQILGWHYGAQIGLASCGPVHGMISQVHYDISHVDANKNNCNLFAGIEQGFNVTRYHSLAVTFPDKVLDIEPMSWCDAFMPSTSSLDEKEVLSAPKICMALRHKINPHFGLQFHPESIGSGEPGYKILRNFCIFVAEGCPKSPRKERNIVLSRETKKSKERTSESTPGPVAAGTKYTVLCHKIPPPRDEPQPHPEAVFESLFASSENAFWLDSSTGTIDGQGSPMSSTDEKNPCPIRSNSRFSIMGDDTGPLSKRVEYYGKEKAKRHQGLRIYSHDKEEIIADENILGFLGNSVSDRGIINSSEMIEFGVDGSATTIEGLDSFLPFEYRGGYVGYLGYGVRHDTLITGSDNGAVLNGDTIGRDLHSERSAPGVPTAAFLFADRSMVYDHWTSDWYLIGVALAPDNEVEMEVTAGTNETTQWIRTNAQVIRQISVGASKGEVQNEESARHTVNFDLDRSKEQYKEDIMRCHAEIRNGESYELCLTNQLRAKVEKNRVTSDGPYGLYKILRKRNPAPFAAFLNFGAGSSHNLKEDAGAAFSICCSSPERFLSMKGKETGSSLKQSDKENSSVPSRGWETSILSPQTDALGRKYQVESKPIKGTTARMTVEGKTATDSAVAKDAQVAEELRLCVKNRAENLMIVDLLRNDLGRVCGIGTVNVPRLMEIESYTTVHQLVSTVRGTLDANSGNAIDVISACFPGGSMTGAPKIRSINILNEIENDVCRGPYSGCLGYISLNGCMDMNIIIRSAVVTAGTHEAEPGHWDVSIGAGGAITALSEIEDEYNEMLLKARAVQNAVEEWACNLGKKTS